MNIMEPEIPYCSNYYIDQNHVLHRRVPKWHFNLLLQFQVILMSYFCDNLIFFTFIAMNSQPMIFVPNELHILCLKLLVS